MKMRLTAAALALLLLLSAAAACGSAKEQPADTTASDINVTAAETEEALSDLEMRLAEPDDLPEADYNGYQFRLVIENNKDREYLLEAETGDVVDDVVYQRNLAVEERYGIKMVLGHQASHRENAAWIIKQVAAGDDSFDLVSSHVVALSGAAINGSFINWYDLPYINFEKPWWSRSNIEDLTYSGVAFLGIGDFALNAVGQTWCMYFDKQQAENYNIGDVYGIVEDSKWTLAKQNELTKGVYADLDGDNTRSAEDFYGFSISWGSALNTYVWAFDNPVCRKQPDGRIDIVFKTEKMPSICEAIYSLLYENETTFYGGTGYKSPIDGSNQVTGRDKFLYGKTLFATAFLEHAIYYFRELESDFGIIPYPKWNEEQADYYTMVDGGHAAMGVPVTIQDAERTGIIVEALNAESYRRVIPVYIETALKTKYTRDSESVRIVELLLRQRVFDFGYVYDNWQGCSFWMQDMMNQKNADFESYYAKNSSKMETHYQNVFEIFEEAAGS